MHSPILSVICRVWFATHQLWLESLPPRIPQPKLLLPSTANTKHSCIVSKKLKWLYRVISNCNHWYFRCVFRSCRQTNSHLRVDFLRKIVATVTKCIDQISKDDGKDRYKSACMIIKKKKDKRFNFEMFYRITYSPYEVADKELLIKQCPHRWWWQQWQQPRPANGRLHQQI